MTNRRKAKSAPVLTIMLWVAVLALTALRVGVAASGALNDSEALLCVCAAHPEGAYIEGPAGAPLLVALIHLFFGSGVLALRTISPLALLLLSWCLWWISRCLAPHRPAVALLAVLGLNLLPLANLSSLVMDGALVTASLSLLAVVSGWAAVATKGAKASGDMKNLKAWTLFGAALGLGTLFFPPLGCLLPIAIVSLVITQGVKGFPWRGVAVAAGLLIIGWGFPLAWNARHDWIEWSSVAEPFGSCHWQPFLLLNPWMQAALVTSLLVPLSGLLFLLIHAWREYPMPRLILFALPFLGALSLQLLPLFRGTQPWFSPGLVILVSAVLLIPAALLALSSRLWLWVIGLPALLFACGGAMLLLVPSQIQIPPGLPSPIGVQGVGDLAREIVSLRKERPDAKGESSFLIAATPGLAALLGEKIAITYPERPGAPSVFVAESPSLNSSYALWPGYADAVSAGEKDPLYTEEKTVSPFLGRTALYITTEAPQELPQTIKGAFNAVGLLKEVVLNWNGQLVPVRIYQCEGYRALSL